MTFLLTDSSGKGEADGLYRPSLLWLFKLNLWPSQVDAFSLFIFGEDGKIALKAIKMLFWPSGFMNRHCGCPLLFIVMDISRSSGSGQILSSLTDFTLNK